MKRDVSTKGKVPGAEDILTVFVPEDGGALPRINGSFEWIQSQSVQPEARRLRLEAAMWTSAACQLEAYYFDGNMKPLCVADLIQNTQLLQNVQTFRGVGEAWESHGLPSRFSFHSKPFTKVLMELALNADQSISILLGADAFQVGGNFTKGGVVGVEEALCIQSTLQMSLRRAATLAERQGISDTSDSYIPEGGVILSPKIQFFRAGPEEGFRFLEEPFDVAAVVTVAMPNSQQKEYRRTMEERIAASFEVAAGNSSILVITELGHGMAQHNPKKVGDIIASMLLSRFQVAFSEVHFIGGETFLSACRVCAQSPDPAVLQEEAITQSAREELNTATAPILESATRSNASTEASPIHRSAGRRMSLPPILDSILPDQDDERIAETEGIPRRSSRHPSLLSDPGALGSAPSSHVAKSRNPLTSPSCAPTAAVPARDTREQNLSTPLHADVSPHSAPELHSGGEPARSSMRKSSLLSAPGAIGFVQQAGEASTQAASPHLSRSRAQEPADHATNPMLDSPVSSASPSRASAGHRHSLPPTLGLVLPAESTRSAMEMASRRHSWSPSAVEDAAHANSGLASSMLSSDISDEDQGQFFGDRTGRAQDAPPAAAVPAAVPARDTREQNLSTPLHADVSPHSAPELHSGGEPARSSMRKSSLLSAPGAIGFVQQAGEASTQAASPHLSRSRAQEPADHATNPMLDSPVSSASPSRASAGHRHSLPPTLGLVLPAESTRSAMEMASRRHSWSPSAVEDAAHANSGLASSMLSSDISDEDQGQFFGDRTGRAQDAPPAAAVPAAVPARDTREQNLSTPLHADVSPHSAPELHSGGEPARSSMRKSSLLSAPGAIGFVQQEGEASTQAASPHLSRSRAQEPADHATNPMLDSPVSSASPSRASAGHRHSLPPTLGLVLPAESTRSAMEMASRRHSWSPSAVEDAAHANSGLASSMLSSDISDEDQGQFFGDRTGRAQDAPPAAAVPAAVPARDTREQNLSTPLHADVSPHSAPELHSGGEPARSSRRKSSLLSAPGAIGFVQQAGEASTQAASPHLSRSRAQEPADHATNPMLDSPVSSASPSRASAGHRHSLPPTLGLVLPAESTRSAMEMASRRHSWSPSAVEHAAHANSGLASSMLSSDISDEDQGQFFGDRTGRSQDAPPAAAVPAAVPARDTREQEVFSSLRGGIQQKNSAEERYGTGGSKSSIPQSSATGELAGESATGTIIMDSGSGCSLGFDTHEVAALQDLPDLEVDMLPMDHSPGQSMPGAEIPQSLDTPCETFFDELEACQREAFKLTDPVHLHREIQSTRKKLQELQDQRATVASQRRRMEGRQADLDRSKSLLVQELKNHHSSKGGCSIS